MGSGSSKAKVKATQTGADERSSPSNSPLPGSRSHTRVRPYSPPSERSSVNEIPMTTYNWPLPERMERERFNPTPFNPTRYRLPPTSPSTLSVAGNETISLTTTIPYHNRETSDQEWQIVDSQTHESAHVQSQLTGRSHGLFNLATSTDIDGQMKKFQQIYKKADERVKRRLDKVTSDADKTLVRIIEDANREQDRLLKYNKDQQVHHEKQYQEWLQKYVIELNKWRSAQLAELQEHLNECQSKIAENSQKYVESLNVETSETKMRILQEEQDNARIKTKDLTDKIHTIARTGNLQQLGSESSIELNLKIQASVGQIPADQSLPKAK